MKEIQPRDKDKIVLSKQAEQQKEVKLIGRIRPRKGHTLFEVNRFTGEIKKAKFESQTITLEQAKNKNLCPSKKVLINKDCVYISSLNTNNVKKN